MYYRGTKYRCCFCEEMGIDYEHDGSQMGYHPQSGDGCCEHCANSIVFEYCKFCDNFNWDIDGFSGKCKLDNLEKDLRDNCKNWTDSTLTRIKFNR